MSSENESHCVEADVKAAKFLLIASGVPSQAERARGLLAEHGARTQVHVGWGGSEEGAPERVPRS